jgi:hypothetical protein
MPKTAYPPPGFSPGKGFFALFALLIRRNEEKDKGQQQIPCRNDRQKSKGNCKVALLQKTPQCAGQTSAPVDNWTNGFAISLTDSRSPFFMTHCTLITSSI